MDIRPSRRLASLPDVGRILKEDFQKMGFGGPQANVSTGGVRGRGSALPVLGNHCLAGITVTLHLLGGPLEGRPALLLLETARSEDP